MARQDPVLEAAEDMMIEAWALLMRMPDQERSWLASGGKSGWPDIVRDKIMDYADIDARPRLQLGRREVALVDRVFNDPGCLVMEIAPDNRALVGIVLMMKSRHEVGGFRWERVWEVLGGQRSGATTDGLRRRYERSLRVLAVAETRRQDMTALASAG